MVGTFKLMTVNLLNGRADPGHLSRVLDRFEPDLVVTQEMGVDTAEVIAAKFPHHDLRPDVAHRGRGIASRFDAEFGALALPWRPGSWARVDFGPRRLVVAGVHMLNPTEFPWWRSVPGRRDQLEALISWADDTVEPDEAIVVAGDMNATPLWPMYRRLAERWSDLALGSSSSRPAPTWAWRPSWPLMLRIDHVFGTGVLGVGTAVERVDGSDHAALLIDLEFERKR